MKSNEFLSTGVLAELDLAINTTLGFRDNHEFGHYFIGHYVSYPQAYDADSSFFDNGYTHPQTDYESMRDWCTSLGCISVGSVNSKDYLVDLENRKPPEMIRLEPEQHQILIGFLLMSETLLAIQLVRGCYCQEKTNAYGDNKKTLIGNLVNPCRHCLGVMDHSSLHELYPEDYLNEA